MKTLKQVLAENPDHKKLIKAVISNLNDPEQIIDINKHAIEDGFGNFIYYKDTVAFFKKYKKEIIYLGQVQARDMGIDMLSMVMNFNCLLSGSYVNRRLDYTQTEIGEAIFGNNYTDYDVIQNAMVWFAAETVCRMFED